jgi:uncharacterized protein (DUF2147 family)
MMTRTLSKVALVLLLASPAFAGEAIYGVWVRGGHEDEKLEFYDCDGQLCAKETVLPPDGSPAIVILRHAAKVAPNQWKGPLFNPENSKLYSGTITLDKPNEFTLKGCLIAFLCQSETWTRDITAAPDKAAAPSPDKAGPTKTTPNPGAKTDSNPTKTAPSPAKAAPSADKTAPSSAKTAPSPAKAAPGADKKAPGAAKPTPGADKKPPAADKKPPDAEPAQ